jgi:GWxTD domain-containing protein
MTRNRVYFDLGNRCEELFRSWVSLYRISLFAGLLLVLQSCSSSNQTETTAYQSYYDYVNAKAALPDFNCKLFWSPDSSGPRLDVYVSVKESRLRYNRDSNSFSASYTCLVRLSGNVTLSKEIDRKVVLSAYPGPDQNSYDAFFISIPINVGEHSVQISVTDNESKQRASKSYSIEIPEIFGRPIVLGDIMFLARYDSLGQGKKITPFILSNVGFLSDTLKFFTVISSKNYSRSSLFFYVYRLLSKEPNVPAFNVQMSAYQPMSYNPCGEDIDTILVYQHSAISSFNEGISFVFGSVPNEPPGNFLLKVLAKDDSNNSAIATLKFQVHGKNFPAVSDNLRDMVSSLSYIAATSEIKKITAGRSDSSMGANLITFWKEHGGLAKMAQYYQRVGLANQLFTSCIEGWRTPMGMYYIVCGAPDNVESEGEWDERWNYYQSSNQNSMTIVFRLAQETLNIEDRFYRTEQVYSNADLWDYYVNQWRTPY